MKDYKMLVRALEIEHPEYTALAPHWRTIRDLKEGVIAIGKNIAKYVPKRPDEDDELYKMRLDKFSYTPVMANAVNKYSAKLSGSPVQLSGAVDEFWTEFRARNNDPTKASKRAESNLLHEIFEGLLYYSKCWAAIDRPDLGFEPRTAYEEQGLKNAPYITLYEPLQVPYWGDDWCITRQYYPLVKPFQAPKTMCRWMLWSEYENVVYEAEIQLRTCQDELGNKYETLKSIRVGETWVDWKDDSLILEPVKVWQHGLDICLMVNLDLPSEKWVCKQVYNKQVQHLRIENAWTDAGYISGVVQRVFTPPDAVAADDPRQVWDRPNYQNELKLAGNAHILIGKSYAFSESTGAALGNLQGQLDKIESQIKELVSLHFASTDTSVLNQSGASKSVDMSLMEDSMRYYGEQVLTLYNSILSVVAKLMKKQEVLATGLSNYTVEEKGELIDQMVIVETLPSIPPTAKKIAYKKLAQLMVGTVSPEEELAIEEELDKLFTASKVLD